ncbi:hypothetical protein NC652_022428 [Populus alba x Populus x berolinensis]|nr:hypothetical protein NC652_022428 [Populus alba x Populus x berolinensis]
MDSRNSNPPCMRVLTRHPQPHPHPHLDPHPLPLPLQIPNHHRSPHPRSLEGVVLLGSFPGAPTTLHTLSIGSLNSNAFGSGHLDKTLFVDKEEIRIGLRRGKSVITMKKRKGSCSCSFARSAAPLFIGSRIRVWKSWSLKNSGFAHHVCHVILYIQEGSRFDTHVLQKFRVLQASKHALTPYVRSRTIPPLSSRPHSSLSSSRLASSTGSSPVRSGSFTCRNSSAVSIKSGLVPMCRCFRDIVLQ